MAFEEKEDQLEKLDLQIWKKIFKVMFTDKKTTILLVLFVILLGLIDTFYPLLNKYAMDTFFVEKPNFDYFTLFIILYILIILGMFIAVSGFIAQASKLEEMITYTIRKQAFCKLQELSFSYFDVNSSGWILARLTSDTKKLASIVSWGIVDALWAVIVMLGIVIISFIINPKLALILLCLIPVFLVIGIIYRNYILKKYRSVRKINSAVTQGFSEGFMGANTTKTLVLEDNNYKEFDEVTTKYYRKSMGAAIFSSFFWPTILVIGYLGVAVIVMVGSKDVLQIENVDELLLGASSLYLFINFTTRFFDPIMSISRVMADFQQAQASAERVLSLIETNPDIVDTEEVINKYGGFLNPKKENYEELIGDITFDNVTFAYKGTSVNVLENFNLEIKAGETVAFVGETGSGKSTIVNLICRFYEPTTGKILIDGKDYKERSVEWLRSKLGYVLQTPQLFGGTIMENVRYGKLDATDEEIIEACKLVNAHSFISKLPDGYNTDLGEGGNKLSLGEKQLISFARAIVANPSLLVLDEATSSIDTENEKVIIAAMNKVMKNRTSFIVAHRLSTVVNADKIIVLKNGKILEMGNHTELLYKKGYYFDLYRNQFLQDSINETLNN